MPESGNATATRYAYDESFGYVVRQHLEKLTGTSTGLKLLEEDSPLLGNYLCDGIRSFTAEEMMGALTGDFKWQHHWYKRALRAYAIQNLYNVWVRVTPAWFQELSDRDHSYV